MFDSQKYLLIFAFASVCCAGAFGSNEILSILNDATDLSSSEVSAIRPLFENLQNQYDLIVSDVALGERAEEQAEIEMLRQEITEQLDQIMSGLSAEAEGQVLMEYDTQLPTLNDLLRISDRTYYQGMTQEQIYELEDMQAIIADTFDEAQSNINELTKRALNIESELFKLNKPKIVEYVYKALSVMFRASARLRRSAYCVYSHVPQLNESLHNINDGVDCYTSTAALIVRVQIQTVETVRTIKDNVLDLAKVYKKIAAKHSLMGKILTSLLNIMRILNDVRESYSVAMKALDAIENQLPEAASHSVDCAQDFASKIPFVAETVNNVTVCLAYVEEPTTDYDFMLPENERTSGDFNDIE